MRGGENAGGGEGGVSERIGDGKSMPLSHYPYFHSHACMLLRLGLQFGPAVYNLLLTHCDIRAGIQLIGFAFKTI